MKAADVEFAVQRMTLREGDTLVLRHADALSEEARKHLSAYLRSLPLNGAKVAVLDCGAELAILGKPEPAATLAIGAAVPGLNGYIYAGLMRGDAGQADYHLAVLTGPAADALKGEWGKYGKSAKGADSRRNGLANTEAMAGAGSKLARAVLDAGAHIASLAEAQLCSANVHDLMPTGYHWTSTQYSPSHAWVQAFEYGLSNLDYKDSEYRAVAVRRFNPSDFGPSKAAS